ncbi:MAG: response regulator [Acidobacteriota bacterium]|nr:response regulator [Acidobacteriota bacterium]
MSGDPIRVLLIDDEPSLLRMMSLYLSRKGFTVAVAANAQDARAQSAAGGFDAVVIDATLPGATLDQLAREFLAADPRLHLLAVSGYPVDMSRLAAEAPRRVAFLHKPFSGEMLAATLRRLLGAEEESL